MPQYTCAKCQKTFAQIGHYNTHIARKKPCKVPVPVEEPVAATATNPTTNQTIKPLLKYVGGKTQILKEVLTRFPPASTIRNYYEPFVGGGSVLFAFLENNPDFKNKVIAADLNPRLINFYKVVRNRVEEFLIEIRKLVEEYNAIKAVAGADADGASQESFYYTQRVRYNTEATIDDVGSGSGSVLSAALFLFLNKTCFRGLHRCGPRGFNVPFGHYKNPAIYDEAHVRAVSALLARVELRCEDFAAVCADAAAGDFVYLDPPYVPVDRDGSEEDNKKNSFTSYNLDGFGPADHERFFTLCEGLRSEEKGVSWLMSNSEVALVTSRFTVEKGYETAVVSCRRAISPKEPGSRVNEVLIRC